MKKFLMISVLCALVFTGCKDDSEPEVPTDADYTGLVLNEICGNDGNASEEDWIELYNTSGGAIGLNGVKLVKIDEDGVSEVIYTFPEGATISGKGYLLKVKGVDFTQGISNTKSVAIVLQTPSGKDIDKFDKDVEFGEDGSHGAGGSYARIPDGTGEWTVVTKATKGAANKVTEPEEPSEIDYTGLVLNELNGNKPKYIELYNSTDRELDITGVQMRKDDEDIVYIAPEGTKIAAHGFLVLLSDQTDYSLGFTSGLSAKKSVKIELLSPKNATIDVFKNLTDAGAEIWGETPKYNGEKEEMAYARKDNGAEWYMMKPTQGGSNSTTAEVGVKIEW